MKNVLILFGIIQFCCSLNAQSVIDYSNWQLVFSDEFNDYTQVNQLLSKWRLDYPWGPTLTGNVSESQYYTPDNISFQTGNIIFKAEKQDPPITYNWSDENGTHSKNLKYTSGMLFSQVPLDGGCWDGNIGFAYGMFEIRCKMPKGAGTWPAFWLYSGPTEIDVFEFYDDKRMFTSTIHDWNNNGIHTACNNHFKKSLGADLTEEFHNYACIWDNEKVSIFFDSVEVWTTSREKTHSCPATIIINLAMNDYATLTSTTFEVDYVRAYKVIDNTKPVKSVLAWEKNDLIANKPITHKASTAQGSMYMYNQNKIVYRGSNNKIKILSSNNNNWSYSEPPIIYSGNSLVGGTVVADTFGNIYYKGKDSRLHTLQYQNGVYNYQLIDDGTLSNYSKISATAGQITVFENKVFYRGTDNKLHFYHKSGESWSHVLIPYTYKNSDLIAGNIISDESGNIYYRGANGRLNCFINDGSNYTHTIIGDATIADNQKVSNGVYTIFNTYDGIIYHAKDHTIQRYKFLNNTFVHENILVSNSNVGVRGSVKMVGNDKIYFRDALGKISILTLEGNIWKQSYPSSWGSATNNINIATDNFMATIDGKIHFINSDAYIKKHELLPFLSINVDCDVNDYRPQAIYRKKDAIHNTKIFPNPTNQFFYVSIQLQDIEAASLLLYDSFGKTVYQQLLNNGLNKIDISNLPKGLYLYQLSDGSSGKLIKN